jgi:hypothetical protein
MTGTPISDMRPCPTCGRLWVCMTGTAANISALVLCKAKNCLAKTGSIDPDCPRCGGGGTDPSCLRGCCECGEELEPDEDRALDI